MGKQITARMLGDDYQALFFWLKVCDMFQPHNNIEKVAYEYDQIKAFDDVVVFYNEKILDKSMTPIAADYFQLKFHVTNSEYFTYENLMDPKAINATSVSILQKVHNAQKEFTPSGENFRFHIVTTWHPHPDDALKELISNEDGQIRLDRLSKGGIRSKFGKVREAWKEHLGIATDDELMTALQPVRFKLGTRTITELQEQLNNSLLMTGFKPISKTSVTNPYINIIQSYLKAGVSVFNRESIIDICRKEELLTGRSIINLKASKIGIRSFSRYSEYLDDEMDQMTCLLEHFNDRTIKNDTDWNGVVHPKVEAFLKESTKDKKEYHLHLETHASIAFLAGRFLEPKSGIKVYPVQSSQDGRVVWEKSEVLEENYPDWNVQEEELDNAGDDIAVVIAVRHKILEDVKYFIEQNELPIKKLIVLTPGDNPGADVIKNGTHAWLLADKLATQINNRNFDDRKGHMHFFMSGPNGLSFFIGQLSKAFGEFTLYEYNFEQRKPGDYRASITF